mmetsp:Transcript_1644/g.5370  ORF Transcript_1644/g.5370 Transcript_1644/m.5370 type:complete len:84 (-) Transcript_1644:369-620(-)
MRRNMHVHPETGLDSQGRQDQTPPAVASTECEFFGQMRRRPIEPPACKLVIGEGLPALCFTGVLRTARRRKLSSRVWRWLDSE